MLKWIKNSKSSRSNKSSNYRGVAKNKQGKYESSIVLSKYDKKKNRRQVRFVIGSFATEKEAVEERIKYILNIL